jgi:hypothetical protein
MSDGKEEGRVNGGPLVTSIQPETKTMLPPNDKSSNQLGSFKDYIHKRKITDSPAGDFTSDVRRDPDFPADAHTWVNVKNYLAGRFVSLQVIAAARTVWRQYQRALRRQRNGGRG